MKTQNNNTRQILKSTAAMALAFCIAIGSAFAGPDNSDSVKNKNEVSKEEAAIIVDLLAEMEAADAEEKLFADINKVTFKIYDSNDQLIFTGSQEQWDDKTNKDLISMKRKAEFLMDAEGTNIYKVF